MKLDELFSAFADNFKVPETLEEAIEYVNKDPSMQTLIEDMAFRQVVLNILIAANIISEKDFTDSIAHFKKVITKNFAEELLSKITQFNEKYDSLLQETEDDLEDDDDWLNPNERVAKA